MNKFIIFGEELLFISILAADCALEKLVREQLVERADGAARSSAARRFEPDVPPSHESCWKAMSVDIIENSRKAP